MTPNLFEQIYQAWAVARREARRHDSIHDPKMRLVITYELYHDLMLCEQMKEHVMFQQPSERPKLFDMPIIRSEDLSGWEIVIAL
jgi:hypothetical protein